MTTFLLWVIAILVAVIGWGLKVAFGWVKTSWNNHILEESKFKTKIEEKLFGLESGISMFFEETRDIKKKHEEFDKEIKGVKIDIFNIKKHTDYPEKNEPYKN